MRVTFAIRVLGRLAAAAMMCLSIMAGAENIVYPDSAGQLNVVTRCRVDNTGATDVTDTLQKIISAHNKWEVIYLPNGTYRVSATLNYALQPTTRGPILQGQSRHGTVIRLANGTFTNPASPQYVLNTGEGVAQMFSRNVANLTIKVGSGNPGAVGIHWYGNNQSLMSDVDIVSEDGQGVSGINLEGSEQGPCGVRNVHVQGFAVGVVSNNLNSVTFYKLSLAGQTKYGIWHRNASLYIDSLTSVNTVPAVICSLIYPANLTLINARLTGGSSMNSAIVNQGAQLFLRDVETSGYQKALTTNQGTSWAPTGSSIREFATKQAVHLWDSSPDSSIRLPMKPLPDVAWEQDTSKWANFSAYKVTGPFQPRRTDSTALRMAIDAAGKNALVIPSNVGISTGDTVRLRGGISRVVGMSANLWSPVLITDEGTASTIKLERLNISALVLRTSKTVIIESAYLNYLFIEGPGDVFISDVVPGVVKVTNPNAHLWAWQFNGENAPENELQVSAGNVWIFGWKHETCCAVATLTGGNTEILGFLAYNSNADDGAPEFDVTNANFSLAGHSELSFIGNGWYSLLVRETRGTQTRELTPALNGNSNAMPLFTAYDPAYSHVKNRTLPRQHGSATMGTVLVRDGLLRVSLSLPSTGTARVRLIDAMGRVVAGTRATASSAGMAVAQMPLRHSGTYVLQCTSGNASTQQRLTVIR